MQMQYPTCCVTHAGIPELLEQIAQLHRREDSVQHVEADDFLVAPGSKELIFLIMKLFEGGPCMSEHYFSGFFSFLLPFFMMIIALTTTDVILISPAWTTYAPQVRLAGKTPIILHTTFQDEFKLTAQALEEAVRGNERPMLLIMNTPGNPC